MTEIFNYLVWLVLLLGPLLFLQRQLHREIQGIFLLATHRADITMSIFSIIFLPGVLIHELSHYLTARLLGVRTGNLSLLPRSMKNGKIQLGYVETVRSDVLRDSLIGVAPFLAGSIFVALAGIYRLRIDPLTGEGVGITLNYLINNLGTVYDSPDFWLWFYLVFTVSSTMMPSASDRRAWLPMAVMLLILIGLTILVGYGPWLLERLLHPFSIVLKALLFVLGISVIFHGLLVVPIWLTRITLERITGYQLG